MKLHARIGLRHWSKLRTIFSQNRSPLSYLIQGIRVDDQQNIQFLIQLKRKNHQFEIELERLYQSSRILNKLSPGENRLVLELYYRKKTANPYAIQASFNEQGSVKNYYYIQKFSETGLIVMSPQQLLNSAIFPALFSKEDVLRVGFDIAAEIYGQNSVQG